MTCGDVAVFPGRAPAANPVALIAALEAPPRAPVGAVLVTFGAELATPAAALLDNFAEIVLVRSAGGWPAFHAALRQTARKWHVPVPGEIAGPDFTGGPAGRAASSM